MPRAIHPDDGMVYACPECDEAMPYRRVQDNTVYEGGEFVCYDCGHTFEEPSEREAKLGHSNGGPKSEAYQRLEEATADD